jgi:Flp pilus assembly protein TadD
VLRCRGLCLAYAAAFWLASSINVLGDTPPDDLQYEALTYRDRVETGGQFSRTVEVRVLLRTPAAVSAFGQLESPYVVGYGEVAFEEVTIEKPDGHRVEVKNGLLEDVNPFGLTAMPVASDVRYKKLTLPGLAPGDRLTYRIVLRQKPLATGFAFGEMKLPPMLGDPVQVYELDLPRDGAIRVRLRPSLGATWENVASTADRVVRRLRLRVPGPDPDAKVTKKLLNEWAEPDVIFTSFATWNEVARWWWSLSSDRLQPDASVTKQAQALTSPGLTPREKLLALHEFVAKDVRYLNVGFGIGRMQPHPAAEVLANRYGDCKDKHALLAALAAAVGVDVRPVLVGTTKADLQDDVPTPEQFQHMISVARLGPDPGQWLWLDSTDRFGVSGYLGPMVRGKRALLIEPNGDGRIVTTPSDPPFVPRITTEVECTLRADGTLAGHNVMSLRSDGEVFLRAALEAVPADQRGEIVKKTLARYWTDAKVTEAVVPNLSNTREALRLEFDAEKTVQTDASKTEWSLWVPVPDFGLPVVPEEAGPDAEKVDLDKREFVVKADVEVPEGWTARAPLSVTLDRPLGRFESRYAVDGRRLTLSRTLMVTRPSINPDEFSQFETLRKAIETDHGQKFLLTGAVSTSADAPAAPLHQQGKAAMEKGDYAAAVDFLQRATKADPTVKNAFHDLGLALYAEGRYEESLRAFSRQIELNPFHDDAYAMRAYCLWALGRQDEGDKDLLKQIEVAPFQVGLYEQLAARRLWQGRTREAADLYTKAASVEPNEPGRWVDVAWATARDGRPDEARAALARVRSFDMADWLKISAAGAYNLVGDTKEAAALAQEGLAALAPRLAMFTPEKLAPKDAWSAEYLARAWYVIGSAALAVGDDARAERYLTAAWKVDFLPDAAWALGTLREKQRRFAEAAELMGMANTVPTATLNLPKDRDKHLEAVLTRLPPAERSADGMSLPASARAQPKSHHPGPASPIVSDAGARLTELRTFRLGTAPVGDLTEEVVVLMGAHGQVEGIRGVSPRDAARLDRVIAKLGSVRLPFAPPDERPFRAARKALLVCSPATPCSLILDLPGLPSLGKR